MQVIFSTVDNRGNVTAYGSDGIADAIHNEQSCRQADATRYTTDYLDNLYQDIIDTVCIALEGAELVAHVARHFVSNITVNNDVWLQSHLLSDLRSKTSVMRQQTAEYAFNVCMYQKFYLTSMFVGGMA